MNQDFKSYTYEGIKKNLIIGGSDHKQYSHYTNFDSLKGILISKRFHFSRGDQMNDKQEITKCDPDIWNKLFISSFAYGINENMAMWGLYGIPWEEAIRISFPNTEFFKWINNINDVYTFNSKNYTIVPNSNKFKISVYDVAYLKGLRQSLNGQIRSNKLNIKLNEHPNLIDISSTKEMTGYIKNNAWQYENEVRIRLELDTNYFDYKKIAISITEELINSMTITFGPWTKNEQVENLIREVNSLCNSANKIKYHKSSFSGLVKYNNACNYCIKKPYQRIKSVSNNVIDF